MNAMEMIKEIVVVLFLVCQHGANGFSDTNNVRESPIVDVKPKSRCTEIYKVSIYINNATKLLPIAPNMQMHTIKCIPTYENTFCLKDEDISKYWERYQSCRWSEDGNNIECPLYYHFKDFSDFFNWNLRTIVIRVQAVIPGILPGDQEQILFTTKGAVVTPLFKCKNGGKITPESPIFNNIKVVTK